ncbi:autotransporter-like protein [Yoonia maricola]|uniref:Autotransporter-like protein n=1 Tax=Yoonia maricola TaxID=420999 RepID=A0A2M8W0T3_9RHOB|nr:autotransporter domain-containing protein [Yoonia maricola]PJI84544.1 autotransporter-like protein [Yoonia maricola]
MNLKTLLTATALTTIGAMAAAQDTGDFTVGTGLSTFGLNLEGAYQIDPQWRARGAFMGGLSLDFDETDDGDTVEGEFNLGGLAALADYYPMQNGWRISGGLFLSNTDLSASGQVNGDEADVTAEFANKVAPMITTGYDWRFGSGWAMTSEVGVILTGGIDIEYEAENPADQAAIDADPDVRDAISDAADIKALPYLSLGVSYTF